MNPWLEPHSCGEICGRDLACKQHQCTRPCHSGRCGPCAQQLTSNCFCGATSQMRRCSERKFTCGRICGKELGCKVHKCQKVCHDGDCGACGKVSMQSCRCGRVRREQPCAEPTFSCEVVCDKPLPCGCKCERVCHAGDVCPPCPRTLPRPCYCGKKNSVLPCKEDVSSCGGTCGKLLPCGIHRCAARCHPGECPKCMIYTLKSCRCGKSNKKELPCSQDYKCERKCENQRNCKRHKCHQRCCPGTECPPCQKTCDRPLNCGNHHCQAICHTGPCDPCPRMMTISCTCGHVKEIIPCGLGRKLPHSIHKTCRGLHKDGDVPCGPPRFLDCSLACGNVLPCGVHTCETKCHVVNIRRRVERDESTGLESPVVYYTSETDPAENCDPCERICSKSLQFCAHTCPLPCHLNSCPDCKVVVHLPCHCKLDKKRPIICSDRLDDQKREAFLSCGAKCVKVLFFSTSPPKTCVLISRLSFRRCSNFATTRAQGSAIPETVLTQRVPRRFLFDVAVRIARRLLLAKLRKSFALQKTSIQ
jgi:NF-X1-type zinc finger protein NFXL1